MRTHSTMLESDQTGEGRHVDQSTSCHPQAGTAVQQRCFSVQKKWISQSCCSGISQSKEETHRATSQHNIGLRCDVWRAAAGDLWNHRERVSIHLLFLTVVPLEVYECGKQDSETWVNGRIDP